MHAHTHTCLWSQCSFFLILSLCNGIILFCTHFLFYCVNVFSCKKVFYNFFCFLNVKLHLCLCVPITLPFEQHCPPQLAILGCGLGLHLSGRQLLRESPVIVSPLLQSHDLPQAALPSPPSLYQLMFILLSIGWFPSFFQAGVLVGFDIHSHLSPQRQWLLETSRPAFSRQQRVLGIIFLSERIILNSLPPRSHPKLNWESTSMGLCRRCFNAPVLGSFLFLDKAGSLGSNRILALLPS